MTMCVFGGFFLGQKPPNGLENCTFYLRFCVSDKKPAVLLRPRAHVDLLRGLLVGKDEKEDQRPGAEGKSK